MGIINDAMGDNIPMAMPKAEKPKKAMKAKAKPKAKPVTKTKKAQKGGIMGFNRS